MKIYISIPISNLNEKKQREHADMVKAKLSRIGWEVINPFDIYAGENPNYMDYLCADLRELEKCDAIIMCRGWKQSKGCQIEHKYAEVFGKRIMFENVELI